MANIVYVDSPFSKGLGDGVDDRLRENRSHNKSAFAQAKKSLDNDNIESLDQKNPGFFVY